MSALTGDDPGQRARLLEIEGLHDRWQREVAGPAIAAVETGDPQVAVDIARSDAGKVIVDQIRRLTAEMEAQARATLEAQQAIRDEAYLTAQRVVVGAPLLAAILSALFSLVVAHQIVGGVRKVRAAATALAAGDLSRRATVGSNDEVVVLMSGYAPDIGTRSGPTSDPLEGIEGAVFVPKPFDPNGLVAAVRSAMNLVPA